MKDYKRNRKLMFIDWASCNGSPLQKSHYCESHLQIGQNPNTVAEDSGHSFEHFNHKAAYLVHTPLLKLWSKNAKPIQGFYLSFYSDTTHYS